MIVADNEHAVFYDVDETLILHTKSEHQIEDPYLSGHIHNITPHRDNILMLKRHHLQGKTIVVWSYGGVKWAEVVVAHFGLEEYVDFIIPKLHVYCDDKDITRWGINNIYLQPNGWGK